MRFGSTARLLFLAAISLHSVVCAFNEWTVDSTKSSLEIRDVESSSMCLYYQKPDGYHIRLFLVRTDGWYYDEDDLTRLVKVCGGKAEEAKFQTHHIAIHIVAESINTVLCVEGMLMCPVDEPLGTLQNKQCVCIPFASRSCWRVS